MAGPGGALIGLVVIAGVLTFTNAGNWMMMRLEQLPGQCSGGLSIAGPSVSGTVCNGLGRGVEAIGQVASTVGDAVRGIKSRFTGGTSSGGSSAGLDTLGGSLRENLAGLSSPSDRLQRMMQEGPGQGSSSTIRERFQQAVDSFTIGQRYTQSGNAAEGLPWLQQGARQPEGFGLMSQLSLANLYRTGGSGVAANPTQAQAYYGLASRSISELNQSNTAEAQQLLRSLNASPQQVHQQIAQAMATMKRDMHR